MTTKLETNRGFSENPLMIGYDNRIFEGNEALGFRFPQGQIISSDRFISLDVAIEEVRSGYPTFLNIGDSSTSGWDSNKTFKGNDNPNSPFFNYKTYSNLLTEQLFANVINAGVPGYTSYQGKKYLEGLLKYISKKQINIDYVTIFFGNNDCTYNQLEDKVRIDHKKPSDQSDGERVTVEDFRRNLVSIIETTREYGVKPILIAPPIHYDWEPGIRADQHKEESLETIKKLEGTELGEQLQEARELYKRREYRSACEKDRVLPRLKEAYRKTILQIAKKTKTAIVDIQHKIPLENNSEYFADYCHPLEKTNQMIVNELRKIRFRDVFRKPDLSDRIKRLFRKKSKSGGGNSGNIPTDTYTFY